VASYSWNAENRPTAAGGVTYTYDGDGWRAKKSNGTLCWRGLGGEILAETNLSGTNLREFVYFGGARIARREESGTVYYFFSDHLGTARVMTNATGKVQQESTYYPFGGEQRVITNTVDNRYKFTGFERDAESGLDDTLFRKYAQNLGRWLSPDPMAGDVVAPGSLNRYTYVLNNPVNYIDPLGLSVECQITLVCTSQVSWSGPGEPPDRTGGSWTTVTCTGGDGPNVDREPPGSVGGGGGGTPKDPLDDATAALEDPDCTRNFKDPAGVIKAIRNAKYRDLGRVTQKGGTLGRYYPWPASVVVGTKIAVNSQVNWAAPGNLLDAQSAIVNAPVSAGQLMDITLLHEAAHYKGKIGDPNKPDVEQKLWRDCIE
jgi:RHS repeat-associated protein